MAPFSKEDKILIKSLYEMNVKVTTVGILKQIFQIKVGRRTASTGCW